MVLFCYSSDEDDCHPNIEINTWRRLKAEMRARKGIVKKEPVLLDKWNTTAVNTKKQKYDITGNGNDDSQKIQENDKDENKEFGSEKSKANENNNNNEKSENENEKDQKKMRKDEANKDDSTKNKNESDEISKKGKNINEKEVKAKKAEVKKEKKENNEDENGKGHLFEARSDPKVFLDEYLPKIKKFAKMKNDEKADEFVKKYYELVHEATEGYIITFAVDRAVEGATQKQLAKYSRRCLTIHNLIQSCQSANVAPKVGVAMFFKKMENPQV